VTAAAALRDELSVALVGRTQLCTATARRNGEHLHAIPLSAVQGWFAAKWGDSVEEFVGGPAAPSPTALPTPPPPSALGFSSDLRQNAVKPKTLSEARDAFNRELGKLKRILKKTPSSLATGVFSPADTVEFVRGAELRGARRVVELHGVRFEYVEDEDCAAGGGDLSGFPRFVVAVHYCRWSWPVAEFPHSVDQLQTVYQAALRYQRLLQLRRALSHPTETLHWRAALAAAPPRRQALFSLSSHGDVRATRVGRGWTMDEAIGWFAGQVRSVVRAVAGGALPALCVAGEFSVDVGRGSGGTDTAALDDFFFCLPPTSGPSWFKEMVS
jgi:hypothetical protein